VRKVAPFPFFILFVSSASTGVGIGELAHRLRHIVASCKHQEKNQQGDGGSVARVIL
jgi:hypothetical protein